jgi:Prokaryotic homologs of the JAB domain
VVTSAAREVCFLIGHHGTVLWRDLSGRAAALPDSRARWEAIWRHRAELAEIAHSHPRGPACFSAEDLTTMAAVDDALGRRLSYCVVTADKVLRRTAGGATLEPDLEPSWVPALRAASGMTERNGQWPS